MPVITSAEIITVGTELLLGEIIDTNSARLAADLAQAGVDVYWSQRVGDNLTRLLNALEAATRRSELVLVTGGLGPTDDDITRDAVASLLGEEQVVAPELEAWLRERFATTGRDMPLANLKQARVIPAAEVLPNPIGTAPGWLVRFQTGGLDRVIATLPGPPRELDLMWQEEVLPRLELPTSHLFVRTFKTLGVGESHVAERLGNLTQQANPSVATYAKIDGVQVRVAAKGEDRQAAERLARPTVDEVERILGDSVWGHDQEQLPEMVISALQRRGAKLALADGVTGGLLTGLLSSAQEAFGHDLQSESLLTSVIAWESELMRTLGVPANLLERLPTGAADVVIALAAAIRAFFNTDFGVAIGPGPLTEPNHPRGGSAGSARHPGNVSPVEVERLPTQVVIAIAADDGTTVRTFKLSPLGRAWQRERTAFTSLNLLRTALR